MARPPTAPIPVAAEPGPVPVDITAIRDELLVLRDSAGRTYVVKPKPASGRRVFYGAGKVLHEQVLLGGSTNGDAWRQKVWAPNRPDDQFGSIARRSDGTFEKSCDATEALSPVTVDQAKAILNEYQFMSPTMVRRPHLLGRDSNGVYYYVDAVAKRYALSDVRLFVGKKGAMTQLALTDHASDSAGGVFTTERGQLVGRGQEAGARKFTWIHDGQRTEVTWLDLGLFVNSNLIRDLGIYDYTGTLCERS